MDGGLCARACYHVDAPEWRAWSNPEVLLSDHGVRLDEVPAAVRDAVLALLEASLSAEGYAQARAAMRVNGFLGALVRAPAVLNEFSYSFAVFGVPAADAPWGFSLFGHHLVLNAFFYRRQMVLSPCFMGAEPRAIDAGPHAGTRLLDDEEARGLRLMRALPPPLQRRAQLWAALDDAAMPHGRCNADDQRHLCGAGRDNRVVPPEGLCVAALPPPLQALALDIVAAFVRALPPGPRAARLAEVRAALPDTWFCWIGGFAPGDAFYYRLQSPVVIVEFDHHSGVFLANATPGRFHAHAILRTPNAGDYGMALRPLIPGRAQDYVWEGDAGEDEHV